MAKSAYDVRAELNLLQYIAKLTLFPALSFDNGDHYNLQRFYRDFILSVPLIVVYVYCFVMYVLEIIWYNLHNAKKIISEVTAVSNLVYFVFIWASFFVSSKCVNRVSDQINFMQESFYFKPKKQYVITKASLAGAIIVFFIIFDYFIWNSVTENYNIFIYISSSLAFYVSWIHISFLSIYISVLKNIFTEINESIVKASNEVAIFFIKNKFVKLTVLHNKACEAASEMNDIFSGQIIAILTLNFLGIVFSSNDISKLLLKFAMGDHKYVYLISIFIWILLMFLVISIFTYAWNETSSEVIYFKISYNDYYI